MPTGELAKRCLSACRGSDDPGGRIFSVLRDKMKPRQWSMCWAILVALVLHVRGALLDTAEALLRKPLLRKGADLRGFQYMAASLVTFGGHRPMQADVLLEVYEWASEARSRLRLPLLRGTLQCNATAHVISRVVIYVGPIMACICRYEQSPTMPMPPICHGELQKLYSTWEGGVVGELAQCLACWCHLASCIVLSLSLHVTSFNFAFPSHITATRNGARCEGLYFLKLRLARCLACAHHVAISPPRRAGACSHSWTWIFPTRPGET